MSIQANVNQMLSIAGLMARMNPTLAAKADANAKIKNLEQQRSTYEQAAKVSGKNEYVDKIDEINQQLFELDPTEERRKLLPPKTFEMKADPEEIGREIAEKEDYEQEVRNYADMYRKVSPTAKAEQSAQEALKTEQTRTRKTRRNFLDYIKDEPTSLGVTFGELDPGLQKKLAAAGYSKSERQKIMNRKDAEKNG